ncbi:MAG: SRPBCC family protein [Vulcanimicrobiaceae bacterium]
MNDFATIDEDKTITLVRDLPGPIERVWAFLTDPKFLTRWLSGGIVADRVGGEVRFDMGAEGRITVYEPPRLLEYTWSEPDLARGPILDTVVRWELVEAGNRVRLTLTHKRLSDVEAIGHGAGWHTFLDRLSASLDGREPPQIAERFANLQSEYGKRYNVALNLKG